ncbi:MAG: PAS domain S-box protein [Dehalococcoidia bacterium]
MTKAQILVVEDEGIVAEEIRGKLAALRYGVPAVAVSGKEAIEKAEETRPDLVLMDIKLKGDLDGVEAAERIRARFDIPVVYLTAYADADTLRRAKKTEPFGYILKPFEDKDLSTSIEVALYKHKMEKRLRESEQWLDATLRSIGDAVIATDAGGRVVFLNHVAEPLVGHTQEDAVGRDLNDVFNVVDRETHRAVRDLAAKVISDGDSIELSNHAVLAGDGTEIPIEDCVAPIRDRTGCITGVVLICHDVTEQKMAQEALAQSEEWHRALVDTAGKANLGIAVLQDSDDREAAVVYANDQLCDLLGYSREELLQMSAGDLLPGLDHPLGRGRFREILEGHDVSSYYEATLRRKDDTLVPIEASVSTLTYQGKVAVVSFFRDITRRKQLYEELANHRFHLEGLVRERTEELSSTVRRLRAEITGRKRAEESLQELHDSEQKLRQRVESELHRRAEFTQALHHDLKTPLTAMAVSTEALTTLLKEEPLLSLARRLRRGVARLNSRIDELLDLSRGEIGMLQLSAETLDLADLLKDALEEMSALASSRGQRLISRLPASLPPIKVDRIKVRQIALNLLDNASNHTTEGGTITLSARKKDNALVVEVRDTGVGIPRDMQRRLFDPYQRLEADRVNLRGIGLGLAICKMYVELHGGRIWVRSRPGMGSTFGFSLPLEAAK